MDEVRAEEMRDLRDVLDAVVEGGWVHLDKDGEHKPTLRDAASLIRELRAFQEGVWNEDAQKEAEKDEAWEKLQQELVAATRRADHAEKRARDLVALINTPLTADFIEGVKIEAAHQRERWGTDHDGGKTSADWFWLIGYLAGKALHSATSGNHEKTNHHIISTAAALFNWHAYLSGKTNMRPGIYVSTEDLHDR